MIQDILPRYQETADGIKTEFTPPFDILDSSYIIVYINDVRLATGYSVVSNKIVFTIAPVADSLVTIQRVLPIEWTNENYGSIDKEVFSNILTNLVAQMQTLKEAVDRAVKTEPYDRDDGGSMAEDFIRQMREALDILDEIERLMPSLVALKNEIDTYIEDASDAVVAYINNLTSDEIAEFSQLADQKLTQLQNIISTISTDTTLGGNSASDSITSSQKAVKTYVDGKVSNLQGQIDVKANNNAVVHLSGTETITGYKYFNSQIYLSAGNGAVFAGTNHYYVLRSSGSPYEGCSLLLDNDASKPAFNAGVNKITIGSANIPGHSITPSTSDNSTRIATTAFVKAQGYTTTDTKNTAGSTDTSSKIYLVGATSQAANPQTYSHDTVYVNTSGQLVSSTPGVSTNSTVVATTAYVTNKIKKVSTLPASPDSNTFYFIPE